METKMEHGPLDEIAVMAIDAQEELSTREQQEAQALMLRIRTTALARQQADRRVVTLALARLGVALEPDQEYEVRRERGNVFLVVHPKKEPAKPV